MTEDPGSDPGRPTEDREPDPQSPENQEPAPQSPEDQEPAPQPPQDDIGWLIYLGIGMLVFLALVLLSGLQSSHMGH